MNILFISHDSSLTGAPIVFGHLIKGLTSNYQITADIISLNSGPLDEVYKKIGTLILQNRKQRWFARLLRMLSSSKITNNSPEEFTRLWKVKPHYDLIYCNTVVTSQWIPSIKMTHSCKIILHVHELEIAIEQFCGSEVFISSLPFVDKFIAASFAVKTILISKYGIPDSKIEVVYETIPFPNKVSKPVFHPLIERWKNENNYIVGGSGTTDWRKGIDLFISTAYLCKDQFPSIKFLWVGGYPQSIEFKKAVYEIKKMNLEDTILIIPETPNPLAYFSKFDLFFLSSKEDPFPLVCLESGSIGIPVICFNNAGGIPELVSEFQNCTIPFGSVVEASRRIGWFSHHKTEADEIGRQLKNKIETEFNTDSMAKKVHKHILELIG